MSADDPRPSYWSVYLEEYGDEKLARKRMREHSNPHSQSHEARYMRDLFNKKVDEWTERNTPVNPNNSPVQFGKERKTSTGTVLRAVKSDVREP